ncbi:MAG TPA: hypothetical protein VF046_02190 [Gemmatimonadales bacterium]
MYLVSRGIAGAVALALTAGAAQAQAGLTSSPATVSLTATKAATLTVSPTSATATLASITDSSAANVFSAVNLTTSWNLTSGTSVNLVGWFATPAQALANGTDYIPSSKVEGRVGAAAFAPFTSGATGGVGVANGSLMLFSQAVGAGTYFGSRSDQLDVRLNLANTATVAGNYTGTLNLQAVVQ